MRSFADSPPLSKMEQRLLAGIASAKQTRLLDAGETIPLSSLRIPRGAMTLRLGSGIPSPVGFTTWLERFLLALLIGGIPFVIGWNHSERLGKPLFCLKEASDPKKLPCHVDGPQEDESDATRETTKQYLWMKTFDALDVLSRGAAAPPSRL